MTVFGQPGEYAKGLARAARTKQALCWLLSVAFIVAIVAAGSTTVRLIATVAEVAVFAVAMHFGSVAGRAAVGYRSEKLVVNSLRTSGFDGTVFCGLLLGGGGDADLVIVDRRNHVFVGEVKTVKGTLAVKGDTLYSNGRPLTTQPVPQVRRQVTALNRMGIPNSPVIIVSEATMPSPVVHSGGVAVVSAATLPAMLSRANGPWSTVAIPQLSALAAKQGKHATT